MSLYILPQLGLDVSFGLIPIIWPVPLSRFLSGQSCFDGSHVGLLVAIVLLALLIAGDEIGAVVVVIAIVGTELMEIEMDSGGGACCLRAKGIATARARIMNKTRVIPAQIWGVKRLVLMTFCVKRRRRLAIGSSMYAGGGSLG